MKNNDGGFNTAIYDNTDSINSVEAFCLKGTAGSIFAFFLKQRKEILGESIQSFSDFQISKIWK